MKKLFLISISFMLFSNSLQACCCYDSGQDDYHRLHYFMSQIFLDSELNNLAIDGEWRKILKKETPYKFISKKYAKKLDSLYLNSGQPNSFINFYENTYKDSSNILALSHYAGSVFNLFNNTRRSDSIYYVNDTIPASIEFSIYNFSMMWKEPSMFFWIEQNINFIQNWYEVDWKKVYTFCQNKEELDIVLSVEALLYGVTSAAILEKYIEMGGDINSQYFKLLLIKTTAEFEHIFEHDLKGNRYSHPNTSHPTEPKLFTDSYTYKFQTPEILESFEDYKKLLSELDIKNKFLLHTLRGYVAFLDADFKKARQEYKYVEKLLKSPNNLSKKVKREIKIQIQFLNIIIDSYLIETEKSYQNFIKNLSEIIKKIPKEYIKESYYEVGRDLALKRKDLVTAYQFSTFKNKQAAQLLEIIMNEENLISIYNIVKNKKLLFPKRFPVNHEYIILETIALKKLRKKDFDSAIDYFKKLNKDSLQLGLCQLPYFQDDDFLGPVYYGEGIPKDPSHEKLAINQAYGGGNDCYDWYDCRYDKFNVKYDTINIEYNKLSFTKDLKLNLESIEKIESQTEITTKEMNQLARLYYELSCMYRTHFWNYNCIWDGQAPWSIRHRYEFSFILLGFDFIWKKQTEYMNQYNSYLESMEYLKKAIETTNDMEDLVKYNFKLLEEYKNPPRYWFGTISDSIAKSESISITKKIDSLYKETNYFKDVISECTDFFPKESKIKTEESLYEKEPDDIVKKKRKKTSPIIILLIIGFLSIVTISLFKRKN